MILDFVAVILNVLYDEKIISEKLSVLVAPDSSTKMIFGNFSAVNFLNFAGIKSDHNKMIINSIFENNLGIRSESSQ